MMISDDSQKNVIVGFQTSPVTGYRKLRNVVVNGLVPCIREALENGPNALVGAL